MDVMMLAAFGLYMSVLFGIAVAAFLSARQATANSSPDQNDFILGGRSLNYWVTALSAQAADMSDWLFMGLPGAIYVSGTTKLWVPVSLVVGMFACWHFVAAKLRIATEATGSSTLASYFQRRYNDTSGIIGLATSCVVLLFFAAYIAVGIKGLSLICKPIFGIPYHVGALVSVAAIVMYALMGGYLAVAWTDAFQAVFLLGSLIITAGVAWHQSDGFGAMLAAASQRGVSLSVLPYEGIKGVLALLLDPIGWGLGYFGMPHILSKFMGIKNVSEMHKSKYVGIVWQILALGAAVAVATIGFSFFPHGLAKPELLFVDMVLQLFSPFFAGLIICAILAATFSTMDSMLLVLAGLVTDDIYKQYINPQASRRQSVFIYRSTIVLFALIALLIAYDEQGSTIFSLVEYAWGGIGASFSPLVLVSLYATWPNKYGAASGIITGGLVAALWKGYVGPIAGLVITPIIPGFFAHLVVLFVVSKATSRR